jgi:glutaminase
MGPERSSRSPIRTYLQRVHDTFIGLRDGAVADYIPALAAADPEPFGICMVTADGHVYEVGDTGIPFSIQSISKPFTYALAIRDRGLPAVLERIGVEPSGDAFNEISLDVHGRPLNPMINAGAIAAASLVDGPDVFERILDWYGQWAGRELAVDEDVYRGESSTGHRNRAIAHLLRANHIVRDHPDEVLDAYFRQCSVAVTARDLAVMAATLAAQGRNPLTGEQVTSGAVVDHVLSVMTTCGMYDGAGQWLIDVGLPAKSGVAGGIIGVLPRQLGIAVFSPPLDRVGNSVRGVAAFRQISHDLQLHFLHSGRSADGAVTGSFSIADVPSSRRRSSAARRLLDGQRDAAMVYELSGDVLFAGAEAVARLAIDGAARFVILDLRRAATVDVAAARVLSGLTRQLARDQREVVLAHATPAVITAVGARDFATSDAAKEWCEDLLLAGVGWTEASTAIKFDHHELAAGLSPAGLAELRALLASRRFAAGETIVQRGDESAEIYLLVDGEVEVSITTGTGTRRRLTTLTAGMTFGESAMTGLGVRTADVRARSDGECLVLTTGALRAASPPTQLAVLRNLLVTSHEALARATRQIEAISR